MSSGSCCPACLQSGNTVFVTEPVDREYFQSRHVNASILRCMHCDSLYQDPWPDADEVAGLYGSDYQNYTTTSVPLLAQVDAAYQRMIGRDFIRQYGRDAAVLDFGCGQGGFLRTLANVGCTRLYGFDFVLYEELHSIAGARFFDNLDAMLEAGLRFDVIRMRHVIEHLTDLDSTMQLLSKLLTPGGCIVGQTPDAGHHTTRLMQGYWGPLHYPYHTVLFSRRGLDQAAPRWNLRLASTSPSILPSGWALSFENIWKAASGSRTRGRTAGYTVLMGLSMPMALADRLLGKTANFDFELRRSN